MSSVAFVTLGCKVNQFETEVMEGLFKEAGYEILPHEAKADIYVINTCSVTSLGDKKSRQLIRRVQRQNPEAVIAVAAMLRLLRSKSRPLRELEWCWVLPIVPVLWNMWSRP